MNPVKVTLALANYGVWFLNLLAYAGSGDPRDALAALAWFGSGTYWLWQASRDGD